MARDNNITITGNLTRDPELRFTAGGAAVTDIGVAWNENRRNKETQEWENIPSYFDITCWFDLAENVAATLRKGDRVVVTGNLKWESWQTGDGETRSKVKVIADDVAPSLRWATIDNGAIQRTQSSGGGFNAGTPAPAAPAQNTAAAYDPNEEPF
jgi:single-strand DNA-binding protein